MKKIKNTGNKGIKNQMLLFCLFTISMRLKEFAKAATGNNSREIDTSYEINCAADRNPPRNAYLELLAQPAPIIP